MIAADLSGDTKLLAAYYEQIVRKSRVLVWAPIILGQVVIIGVCFLIAVLRDNWLMLTAPLALWECIFFIAYWRPTERSRRAWVRWFVDRAIKDDELLLVRGPIRLDWQDGLVIETPRCVVRMLTVPKLRRGEGWIAIESIAHNPIVISMDRLVHEDVKVRHELGLAHNEPVEEQGREIKL